MSFSFEVPTHSFLYLGDPKTRMPGRKTKGSFRQEDQSKNESLQKPLELPVGTWLLGFQLGRGSGFSQKYSLPLSRNTVFTLFPFSSGRRINELIEKTLEKEERVSQIKISEIKLSLGVDNIRRGG